LKDPYLYFKIKKGEIIVNLGAHKGNATLLFSRKVGKTGIVISIEPVLENYKFLIKTINRNKVIYLDQKRKSLIL